MARFVHHVCVSYLTKLLQSRAFWLVPQSLLGSSRGRRRYVISYRSARNSLVRAFPRRFKLHV